MLPNWFSTVHISTVNLLKWAPGLLESSVRPRKGWMAYLWREMVTTRPSSKTNCKLKQPTNEIKPTIFQTHILFITIKYFILYYINPFKTIQIICAVINSSQMLSEFHAKNRNTNPQQINHLIK